MDTTETEEIFWVKRCVLRVTCSQEWSTKLVLWSSCQNQIAQTYKVSLTTHALRDWCEHSSSTGLGAGASLQWSLVTDGSTGSACEHYICWSVEQCCWHCWCGRTEWVVTTLLTTRQQCPGAGYYTGHCCSAPLLHGQPHTLLTLADNVRAQHSQTPAITFANF